MFSFIFIEVAKIWNYFYIYTNLYDIEGETTIEIVFSKRTSKFN